jgi:hypothetical protein
MLHAEVLSNPSLLGLCFLAGASEGRVGTLQHAVSLVVEFSTVSAFLGIRLLRGVQVAHLGSVSTMTEPVIYDECTARSSPERFVFEWVYLASKGDGCRLPPLFVVVFVASVRHGSQGHSVLVINQVVENRGLVLVRGTKVPVVQGNDLIQ